MKRKILFITLGFDSLIILLHSIFGRGVGFFNLDLENNLPTYYSGLKLLALGFTILLIIYKERSTWKKSLLWLPISFLFIYLALDEVLTLHEKIIYLVSPEKALNLTWYTNPVFYWVLLFLPLVIFALIYLGLFIKKELETSEAKKFFIFGTIFFGLVIVSEFTGGFISSSNLGYILMTFEESFEIVGSSLFLSGASYHYFSEQREKEKILVNL